jgi:hypothetical protein
LVELHGGRVEARSEGSVAGSEFLVRFPALRRPALSPLPFRGGSPETSTVDFSGPGARARGRHGNVSADPGSARTTRAEDRGTSIADQLLRKEHAMADPKNKMHGEGNPEADRRYREGLQEFAGTDASRKKAREAAESVEQEEREKRNRA